MPDFIENRRAAFKGNLLDFQFIPAGIGQQGQYFLLAFGMIPGPLQFPRNRRDLRSHNA
jgi:hypothetical protein